MYLDRFKLDGKTAVVTGAARGIGLAIVDALSEAGAAVVLTDMDGGAAKRAGEALAQKGRTVTAEKLDVTDPRLVEQLHARLLERVGRIDILVNNAGIAISNRPAETMDDQTWLKVMDVNLNGGVAAGVDFSAAFAGEADADLSEIRRAFLDRAFLSRQERLLRLCEPRFGVDATLDMTMQQLEALAHHEDMELHGAAIRYLGLRRDKELGAPAFVTLDGGRIAPQDYPSHLRMIRRVRGAADANAEMCRMLLQARISHPVPLARAGEVQGDLLEQEGGGSARRANSP